jgi:hypothetical protein
MPYKIALTNSLVQPLTSGIIKTDDHIVTAVNATLLTLCVLLGWATFDLLRDLRRAEMTGIQRRTLGAFIVLTTIAALGVAAWKLW